VVEGNKVRRVIGVADHCQGHEWLTVVCVCGLQWNIPEASIGWAFNRFFSGALYGGCLLFKVDSAPCFGECGYGEEVVLQVIECVGNGGLRWDPLDWYDSCVG
jgi:hypothetical protein